MNTKSIRKKLQCPDGKRTYVKTMIRNRRIGMGTYLRSTMSIWAEKFGCVRYLNDFQANTKRKVKYHKDKEKAREYFAKYARTLNNNVCKLPYIIYLRRRVEGGGNIVEDFKEIKEIYFNR